jgi:hypothetical protein
MLYYSVMREETQMTTETELSGKFSFPAYRLGEFLKRFKKLEKLCKSIDVELPTYTSGEIYETDQYIEVQTPLGPRQKKIKVDYIDVEVDYAQAIVLDGGWELLGVIDHREGIVNTVPYKTVPKSYFDKDGYCDHCNTQRARKETFIVQDENGMAKQIGRQCLRKYLGVDGNQLFRVLEWFGQSFNVNFNEEGDNTIREYARFDLAELLTVTAHWMKNHEYISYAKAQERSTLRSTSGIIQTLTQEPLSYDDVEYIEELVEEMVELTDDLKAELKETVETVIDWAKTQDPKDNSYLFNLKTLAENGAYTWKSMGYSVSMIQAYNNHVAWADKKKVENADVVNEHVGNVKDRLELEVKIVSSRFHETDYGTATIYNFADKEGRRYVWFTTAPLDDEKEFPTGIFRNVKGTVKRHTEYNGIKQTALSRVSLVKG